MSRCPECELTHREEDCENPYVIFIHLDGPSWHSNGTEWWGVWDVANDRCIPYANNVDIEGALAWALSQFTEMDALGWWEPMSDYRDLIRIYEPEKKL